MKKTSRRGIDVDVEELDRLIDSTEQGPLSEADRRRLKTAVHAMAERLVRRRNTEKISAVLEPKTTSGTAPTPPQPEQSGSVGHGRNPATAFTGAEKVCVQHAQLKPGDVCPECRGGRVYRQKEPKTLVRIVGGRRWKRPCSRWNGFAAMAVVRYSPPANRGRRGRKSSMPLPWS